MRRFTDGSLFAMNHGGWWLLRVEERHHSAQLTPHLFDRMSGSMCAHTREVGQTTLVLLDPAPRKAAVLHLAEYLIHCRAALLVDDAFARCVVAVFGGV